MSDIHVFTIVNMLIVISNVSVLAAAIKLYTEVIKLSHIDKIGK